MDETRTSAADIRVLRWGGLAGMLGGVLFLVVFIVVGVFAGVDPAEPEGPVTRFPDIRMARTVENGLYAVVLVLWVTHFLALYRALRVASLAMALFGGVLGIVGLTVLAAGALPHVAMTRIADLYHAPGASLEDQATLGLVWQGTQGIFDALLITGLFILPVSLIALGVAMHGARDFGTRFAWIGVGLGTVGLVVAAVLLVDPGSEIAVLGVLVLILFHIVSGGRIYAKSRVRLGLEDRPRRRDDVTAAGRA